MDDRSVLYLLEQNKVLKDRIKFLEKRVCNNAECQKRNKIVERVERSQEKHTL